MSDSRNASLSEVDPLIANAIDHEVARQANGLELIASENFVSEAVLEAAGSVFTNKYAEGYPGKRYYGGCEWTDVVEQTAIDRAKELFGADHANVQPHSGAQANMQEIFGPEGLIAQAHPEYEYRPGQIDMARAVMTKCHPGASCQQTNRQCHGPAPTFSQKEQQEVSKIDLFLDGEGPKHAVDAVASPGIKIVEHQQMHREVVNREARNTEANAKRCQ